MKKIWAVVAMVWVLAGCASSSMVVTGKARAPIDMSEVELVTEMPADCEVLGIIEASSDAGLTDQRCYDYAVEELKIRAASIGANAVLIESMGARNAGYVGMVSGSSVYMIPDEKKYISGKALYVNKEGK